MLLTLWPWALTFQSQNHVISTISQNHSLHQLWTIWDHSFFELFCCGQTDKQTDGLECPIHADRYNRTRDLYLICLSISSSFGSKVQSFNQQHKQNHHQSIIRPIYIINDQTSKTNRRSQFRLHITYRTYGTKSRKLARNFWAILLDVKKWPLFPCWKSGKLIQDPAGPDPDLFQKLNDTPH